MLTMDATKITYTPEQLTQVTELWERLIDNHLIGLNEERRPYSPYLERKDLDSNHLAALIASDGAETDDYYPVTVTLVSYSDYGGNDYDAANVRALGGTPGVTTRTGGYHGEGSATVVLGELPTNGEGTATGIEGLAALVEIMDSLAEDGSLINDETHSIYIDELAEEAWDSWLGRDALADLEALALDGFEMTDGVSAEIKTAYYAYDENEWNAETATSVINERHDEALAHAARVVLGWDLDALKADRQAEKEQEEAAREAFGTVWLDFVVQHPVPVIGNDISGYYRDWLFDSLRRDGIEPTVPAILARLVTESESAAYRMGERAT